MRLTPTRVIVGAAVIGLIALTMVLFVESVGAPGTAQIVGYQTTADPRKLVVVIQVLPSTDMLERRIEEDARTVRVTVYARPPRSSTALGVTLPVLITLRDPLGDRAVLDSNGAAVPNRGAFIADQPAR